VQNPVPMATNLLKTNPFPVLKLLENSGLKSGMRKWHRNINILFFGNHEVQVSFVCIPIFTKSSGGS
jgi:hypothetical protein